MKKHLKYYYSPPPKRNPATILNFLAYSYNHVSYQCCRLLHQRLSAFLEWEGGVSLDAPLQGNLQDTSDSYNNYIITMSRVARKFDSLAAYIIVESRGYAPSPPLCMLGLDNSGEGAYTRDSNISA